MIVIRSITYNMPEAVTREQLNRVVDCSRQWDDAFPNLHTQRINLTPFKAPFHSSMFSEINSICERTSIRWFNVPVDLSEAEHPQQVLDSLQKLLSENGRAFGNILGVKDNQIRPELFSYYAKFTKSVSKMDVSGKDNFRVGLSINIGNNTPFFPFTKSSGEMSFSIALEIANDMNDVCKNTEYSSFAQLRQNLLDRLLPQIEVINKEAERISEKMGIQFCGFDFSLAPSIDPMGSVITILNAVGIYNYGKSGTMFATSFITDILKYMAKKYKSVGFSGVMYSVLEDLELCKINNQRGISIEQLTMVSTMCGCGLDMVPVCGDISDNEIIAMCYEIAAISCKLNKPLGIRLVPIQHCRRGVQGYTAIKNDADFISNTKVILLDTNILALEDTEFSYLSLSHN